MLAAIQKTFQTGVRAAKACLATGDLQVAAKVIERLAEHHAQLQEGLASSNQDVTSPIHEAQIELLLLQLTMVSIERRSHEQG